MTTKPQSSKAYLTKMQPNLDIIKEMLVKHDMDFLLTIVGRERIGKSSLALEIAQRVDPKFTVEQVVFDIPALYKQVYKLDKGQVVIIDEGATAFFAREAMNTDVKEGIKLLTVMGERNLLIILCVPSFFIIDKYIRQHRVAGLIKVTKRGRFKFWSRRALNASHYNSKANSYAWADACFVDSFGKPSGKLWEDYKVMKSKYLAERVGEYTDDNNGKSEWMSIGEAAKELEMKYNTVAGWARNGKVESKQNPAKRWLISVKSVDKLRDIMNTQATRVKT